MGVLIANKRTLMLSGPCNGSNQEELCAGIIRLNLTSQEDIVLYIDSEGGGLNAAMYIYDAIKESKACVRGVVTGKALSAAFVALLACHHRAAFPHARLMYHAPIINLAIDHRDFDQELANCKAYHEIMISELTRRGRLPRTYFETWSREERYLTAQNAFDAGVIDQIIIR